MVQLLERAERLLAHIWECNIKKKKLSQDDLIAIEELGTDIAYHLTKDKL